MVHSLFYSQIRILNDDDLSTFPLQRSNRTKRNASQTAGEWVISLAQGKSLPSPIRKKYGISRRRKTRFARVNHKDVLTLERVAFRKQQRKERLVRAQQQFERINFL